MNRAPQIGRPLVRRATPADRDVIWNIFLTSVLELFGTHYERAEVVSFANSLEPESFGDSIGALHTLVAEEGGKVVAFGQLDLVSCEVVSLYVAPGSARQGIGRTLLRMFEETARERNFSWIHTGSPLNAVGFFEKEGYKQARMEQLQLPDGSALPRIRMSKSFPEKV